MAGSAGKPEVKFLADGSLSNVELMVMNLRKPTSGSSVQHIWEKVGNIFFFFNFTPAPTNSIYQLISCLYPWLLYCASWLPKNKKILFRIFLFRKNYLYVFSTSIMNQSVVFFRKVPSLAISQFGNFIKQIFLSKP